MHSFSELVIGGVFVAPFVGDVVTALALFLVLRPILHLCRFEKLFSHPAVAELSLIAMILSVLTAAF